MVEACASVLDLEGRALGVSGRGDANAPALGLSVDGVRDQVAQRLAELDAITSDRFVAGADLDRSRGGVSLEGARGGLAADVLELEGLEEEGLGARDRQEG